MTYDELSEFVLSNDLTVDQAEKVRDRLSSIMWNIGSLWDKASGNCPSTFSATGTKNHRSMTYKLRKLAGYSYP